MNHYNTRIGRNFHNLRKLDLRHNLRHASNMKTSQNKYSRRVASVGPGIVVVPNKNPYVMSRMYATQQDLLAMQETDKDISDLEIIAQERAWLWYEKCFDTAIVYKMCRKLTNLELDWSNVKFIADFPEYRKPTDNTTQSIHTAVASVVGISPGEMEQKTVADEVYYYNSSSKDQIHKIRTEQKTASTVQTTLRKGFKHVSKHSITLPAPTEIINAASEFSTGFSMNESDGSSDERITTWLTEEQITVPSNSGILVKINSTRKEDDFDFGTWVAVVGHVEAIFYWKIGQKQACWSFNMNMQRLVCEEIPTDRVQFEDQLYKLYYEGRCNFKYGMKQVTLVSDCTPSEWYSDPQIT